MFTLPIQSLSLFASVPYLSLSLSLSLANPSNKLHKHTHTGGGGGKKAGKLFGRGENFFTLCVVWRVSSVQLSQLHFLLTPDESSRVIEEQVCSKNSLDHHFDHYCVSLIPPNVHHEETVSLAPLCSDHHHR